MSTYTNNPPPTTRLEMMLVPVRMLKMLRCAAAVTLIIAAASVLCVSARTPGSAVSKPYSSNDTSSVAEDLFKQCCQTSGLAGEGGDSWELMAKLRGYGESADGGKLLDFIKCIRPTNATWGCCQKIENGGDLDYDHEE